MIAGLVRMILFGAGIFLLITSAVRAAATAPDISYICDQAAAAAAAETGVPLAVLKAISLNETGRRIKGRMRPWPWTVNMEGKGVWFQSEDAARAYVYKHYKRGARSFDVGCFQINYKWHGRAFASIEEMFEPMANALYAARFLQELYQEKGDWSTAAGAYHSRTPKYANRYRKRFDAFRLALAEQEEQQPRMMVPVVVRQPEKREVVERINRYPFLRPGGESGQLGSLVPVNRSRLAVPLISAFPQEG